VIRGAGPDRLRVIREQSGTSLDAAAAWCVGQVALRQRIGGGDTALAPIARRYRLPAPVLAPAFSATVASGYLTGDQESYVVTESGRAELARLADEFRSWLTVELFDWNMDGDEQLGTAPTGVARRLVDDEPALQQAVPA